MTELLVVLGFVGVLLLAVFVIVEFVLSGLDYDD